MTLVALAAPHQDREGMRALQLDFRPPADQPQGRDHLLVAPTMAPAMAAVAAVIAPTAVAVMAAMAAPQGLPEVITAAVAVAVAATRAARVLRAARALVVTLLLRSLYKHETLGFNQKQCC